MVTAALCIGCLFVGAFIGMGTISAIFINKRMEAEKK